MSSWWDYVVRVSGTVVQKQMAADTGIGETAFSRWKKGQNRPEAPQIVQFARAYGRSPIEALIAAGFIDPSEADNVVELEPLPVTDLDDVELVHEIARRLDVRIAEYERTLVQTLVAVGQLQTYVEAMVDGEEEEDVSEVSEHLGVLVHTLYDLASHVVANPSRLKRMTAESAIELRSRQSGHVIPTAADADLVGQITAWSFDATHINTRQLGVEYVREEERVRRPRESRASSAYTVTDSGNLVPAPEYDISPPPELADAARTAPPGYTPGQPEQGDAGGEENQDHE